MIEEAIGKVIGMAMAYVVSSLGLLLAYYNYRKRILKAEKAFTPAAYAVIALVVTVTVAGTAWILAYKPIQDHGCMCVKVVNDQGQPLKGALVWAENAADGSSYDNIRTDEAGLACVTVRNSIESANQANFMAKIRGDKVGYSGNPQKTPATVASCSPNVDCPDKCEVLPQTIAMNYPDTEWDPGKIDEVAAAEKRTAAGSLGVILPIIIFMFSFWVTWMLYKHFTKKVEAEKTNE